MDGRGGGRRERRLFVAGAILAGSALAWLIWRASRRAMPHAGAWRTLLARWYGAEEARWVMRHAQSEYAALLAGRQRVRHVVLAYHVRYYMLPALSVYRGLLELGIGRQPALERVLALVWETLGPLYRLSLFWLCFIPDPFDVWRGIVELAMATIFPPAGWRRRPVANDATRYAFDIIGCIYLETLTAYGAPELTAVFCRADDRLAGLLPAGIRWERSGTLGMGQACCDFCWRRDQSCASKTGPSRQTS